MEAVHIVYIEKGLDGTKKEIIGVFKDLDDSITCCQRTENILNVINLQEESENEWSVYRKEFKVQ